MNTAKILEWNRDKRTANWVAGKLGISRTRLGLISKQHGLVWPIGSPLSCICPKGHDAAHVGYDNGGCGHCRAKFELPEHLAAHEGGRMSKRWCPQGHDTRIAGRAFEYNKSWCLECKNGRKPRTTGNRNASTEDENSHLERISDEYLRLCDLLWMTPQAWLREEIEERIKRLRA